MISVEEAQKRILSRFSSLGAELVDLEHASGRILAEPLHSSESLPRFDNSSMDGFAVRFADVSGAKPTDPIELKVIGDAPAGQVFVGEVGTLQTVRIMTGAPVPKGADAIVPLEDTDFNGQSTATPAPSTVRIYHAADPKQFIRPKGQDLKKGELVLESGSRIRPQEIGFLASLGIASVPVVRMPRVALFSTGDELIPVGAQISTGKIYESNSYMLASIIQKYQGEVVNLGIIPDQEKAVRECLRQAMLSNADLIVSSAGVSVGAFDFVRSVLENEGKLEFWRVNMRPGKPIAYGEYQKIPFIGLPGNPVSAFVGAELFVRPVLIRLGGGDSWNRPYIVVKVMDNIESDGRESYLRVIIRNTDGTWEASLTGHQGSGNLRSLVQANALLLVPSGVKSLPIGSSARAYLMDDI